VERRARADCVRRAAAEDARADTWVVNPRGNDPPELRSLLTVVDRPLVSDRRGVSTEWGKMPLLSNTDLKQTSFAACVPRTSCDPSTQRRYRSFKSSIVSLLWNCLLLWT
jgi:hypothetical protein